MKQRMNIRKVLAGWLAGVALLLLTVNNVKAASGGLPGAFLNYGTTSISFSVSTPDEINPSYLNPAGLFMVNQNDITLLFSNLYEGAIFDYMCYSYPVRLLGTFAISRVGFFGGHSARVLWVGAGLDCPELLQLQQDVEEKLAAIGWPKEGRKFSGHLTLCRVRSSRAGVELAKLTERYQEFDLGTVRCDALTVYQSQLRPEGPLYTSLGNYKLL